MKFRNSKFAKHWYEWGNEGMGYVSTGYYNNRGQWCSTGIMKKDAAVLKGLTFHNPHS